MSATTNKKALVDFLWEWAEPFGIWAKLLVDKVVSTECSLSDQDRNLVFDYFLERAGVISALPELVINKPSYTPTSRKVFLDSLSEISGVNKLAKGQTLQFSKNITVIYGENGSGKTGYSRILKGFGFSYDGKKRILPDIHNSHPDTQSAKVKFSKDDVSKEFTWDGENTHSDLSTISVFNNDCVQFSLDQDRRLIVSPIGFHLFNLVSDELNQLSSILSTKIQSYAITMDFQGGFHPGTPQHDFIQNISSRLNETILDTLGGFNEEYQTELDSKILELSGLNKPLLETELSALTLQITELEKIISKISNASSIFNQDTLNALISINQRIKDYEGRTHSGITEIAEANGVRLYETDQFKAFIQNAEEYIKLLDTENTYPKLGDSCAYCLQPINQKATDLLRSYRQLLNDTTRTELQKLNVEKQQLISDVDRLETYIVLSQASFGTNEYGQINQPENLSAYQQRVSTLKEIFLTGAIPDDLVFDIDYQNVIDELTNRKNLLIEQKTLKNEALTNLSATETRLKNEINQLKDRRLITEKNAEIKNVIKNYQTRKKLNTRAQDLNTRSISTKTTTAREELVSKNFNQIFQTELNTLRKAHLKIDLSFGTDRGSSKILQAMNRHALSDILSEGEQKAISLAEFLTELQLDNNIAPVVFDDPVNSLDHRITDEVVKRLIELSKHRQVIVFTHSILLFNSFLQQKELPHHKQAGVDFFAHRVKTNYQQTGILAEPEENSSARYISRVNQLLQEKTDDEEKTAARGYALLRSAIELCVENEILEGTIVRYRKGVAFPSLMRVNGAILDAHKSKLNDIYEKCCISIEAHSSSEDTHLTPTVAELKTDLAAFVAIRKVFKN